MTHAGRDRPAALGACSFAWCALAACAQFDGGKPVTTEVTIGTGMVRGEERVDPGGGLVRVFWGLPYAAPPLGGLRWRAPRPPMPFAETRAATTAPPACPQPLPPPGRFSGPGPEYQSENCLTLNVFTGARRTSERRPVMVWIHGGGLREGHGALPSSDGSRLARRGVVVVTINYRLGPLGFLSHPALAVENEPGASGNYGLLDQIAALGFVQENIAAFGGDPGNVTLFGESAGAQSICLLQASPLARGLFHRAIAQSGGSFAPLPPQRASANPRSPRLPEAAESQGQRYVERLGLAGADVAAALRAQPLERLLEPAALAGLSFGATVDGWVLPEDPYHTFSSGRAAAVPVLLGSNADEGSGLLEATAPSGVAEYRQWLAAEYGDFADDFFGVYLAPTDADVPAAFLGHLGDRAGAWQMRTWARLHQGAAYLYYFTRVPGGAGTQNAAVAPPGAYRGAEVRYAFDNLGAAVPEASGLAAAWQATDHRLAAEMASYWVNFARTGDPNRDAAAKWPRYRRDRDEALELGDSVRVVSGLKRARLDVFDRYFAALRIAE